MRKILPTLAFLLFSVLGFGQTKTVEVPGTTIQFAMKEGKLVGDSYFFVLSESGTTNLMRLNLLNDEFEKIIELDDISITANFGDSGTYFISNQALVYYDYKSIFKTLTSANSTLSATRRLIGEKLYYRTSDNGIWRLFEADGINNQVTELCNHDFSFDYFIYNNGQSIALWQGANETKLLYVSDRMNNKTFIDTVVHFSILAENNGELFFTHRYKICKTTDFSHIDSTTIQIALVPHLNNLQYRLISDSFFVQFDIFECATHVVELFPPYTYRTVPCNSDIADLKRIQIVNRAGNFCLLWSLKTGQEIGYLSDEGTLSLVKDLFKGLYNGASNIFKLKGSDTLLFAGTNGTGYEAGTNGTGYEENELYLYEATKSGVRSLFLLDSVASILFEYNNTICWSYYRGRKNYFYFRNYNDTIPQAPNTEGVNYITQNEHGEWHRQYTTAFMSATPHGNNSAPVYNKNLLIDKEGNIVQSSTPSYYLFSTLLSVTDDKSEILAGRDIVVKYDKNGEVLWRKSFNKLWNTIGIDHAIEMALDEDNNIIVAGIFFEKFTYGSDTLTTERAATYLAKLDAKDGSFIWAKKFNPTYWTNDCYIDRIVCDKDNNIYLAITYKHFSSTFDNLTLTSGISPVNAIVKFSTDGETVWANNYEAPWLDKAGYFRSLTYAPTENVLYALTSQGGYNWSSSCKFNRWHSYLQKISVDGSLTASQIFEGDDLNGAVGTVLTKTNEIMVAGFYRGVLESGGFFVESKPSGGCNQNELFLAKFRTENFEASGLTTTQSEFYPFDVAEDKDFIYVIGGERISLSSRLLCIRKYNHNGRFLARRIFNYTIFNPFNFNHFFSIDANDSFLAMSMQSTSTIEPYTNYHPYQIPTSSISIYRLNKEVGWETIDEYSPKDIANKIIVSPNPASSFINIQFLEKGAYTQVDFYNVTGQSVKSINLSEDIYQSIDLQDLSDGMYFLHFKGVTNYTHKMIKM